MVTEVPPSGYEFLSSKLNFSINKVLCKYPAIQFLESTPTFWGKLSDDFNFKIIN